MNISRQNWHITIRFLHWLSAVAILILFASGLWMTSLEPDNEWYIQAPFFHKSLGISLLVFTVLRIVSRVIFKKPTADDSYPIWKKRLSVLMHNFLYLILFLLFFSGYVLATKDNNSISVFGLFDIPALLEQKEGMQDKAHVAHFVLAVSMLVMALGHASVALYHHYKLKDNTLRRMLGSKKNI